MAALLGHRVSFVLFGQYAYLLGLLTDSRCYRLDDGHSHIRRQIMLEAISAGAVFMGANTYIGNAPNFMVKSIAEENGIKMPSFFGYMGWSIAILIPTFIIDMVVFFL